MTSLDTAGVFEVEQRRRGVWLSRGTKETLRAACYAASYFSRIGVGPVQVRAGETIHATYRNGIRIGRPESVVCVACRVRYAQRGAPGAAARHCSGCARRLGLLPPVILGRPPGRVATRPVPARPAPRPTPVSRVAEVVVPGEGRRAVEIVWDGTQGGSLERFMNPGRA
jgi:hypothetical protein